MNPSIGRWLVNLAVISIMGVLIDLMLPSGSMKRYVRFLISIVLLSAMLKPIFQIFGQLSDFERYTAQAFATMDFANMSYQAKWLEGQQQSEIRKYFVESMESHMEQQIKQFKGYEDVRVDVEMDERFGDGSQLPDSLRVYVDIGTPASSRIQPVRIKIDTRDVDTSSSDKTNKPSKEEQEIKALLSSVYGIDQNRIEVRFNIPGDNEQKVQGGEVP